MRDRLKILDCNRKGILGLPPNALKLWLCYYMNEDDEQESFMSYAEVEAQTGMGKTSVQKWNHFLERHGWIVDTGKTAYDKWVALGRVSSDNAKQVKVWKVDDPTRPVGKQLGTQSESDHKVYSYGSGSGYASPSSSTRGLALPNPNLIAPDPPLEKEGKGNTETITKPSSGLKSKLVSEEKDKSKTKKNPLAPDGGSWAEWDKHDSAWKAKRLAQLRPRECDTLLDNGTPCKSPALFDRKKTGKYIRGSDYWHFCLTHKNLHDERKAEKDFTLGFDDDPDVLISEPL
jgi:hypothetical protein